MISELEQKAVEDASSNETLEQLSEMVKAKEGVERKLYTSYSLGKDILGLKQGSIVPLYNGKYKSHSFHKEQKESITIFNTFSNTSTSENRTSRYSSGSGSCSGSSSGDMELDRRSKSVEEAGTFQLCKYCQRKFKMNAQQMSNRHFGYLQIRCMFKGKAVANSYRRQKNF